jgi:hypothetical protein
MVRRVSDQVQDVMLGFATGVMRADIATGSKRLG